MTTQVISNQQTLLKKKPLPRRTTIHTTTPSQPVDDQVLSTPSNSPDGTQELLKQLEKAQSTTNDLINQVEKDSSVSAALHSSEPSEPPAEPETSSEPAAKHETSSEQPAEHSIPKPSAPVAKGSALLSRTELEAELDRITSELKEEKKKNARKSYAKGELEIKVSKKGAVQINGLRKLPITIYRQEWERLFPIIDKIKQFIEDHPDELTTI